MKIFSEFAMALTAPDAPRPAHVLDATGHGGTTRYDIYRNNVTVGLTDALAANFPVVRDLVGPEFFSAMAREFLRSHPPRLPIMAFYGDEFADWLAAFPPVASLPYLPGVARLEALRRHSIHAADAAPLDASVLAEAPQEQFGELRLQPHPSARWMTDAQPVLAIWNRHNGQPAASEPAGEILLCRPAMTVLQIAAPLGTSATLQALAAGLPLQDALPADADHTAIFAALFAVAALSALPQPF
ncbi:MAG: DNA-binding domain-containing protein [Paracoccaceae bacterium]